MTAILKDLRSLRAARDRGEITPEQFARAEAVLHSLVEDAVVDGAPEPKRAAKPAPPRKRPAAVEPITAETVAADAHTTAHSTPARVWETVLMVAAGLAFLTVLATVIVGSLTLALTLLVTTIAAGTVWALKNLDE